LNLFSVCFVKVKNFTFDFFVFKKDTEKKIIFGVCKTNDNKISSNESGFAHKIHVSWLYYSDIKIKDTFVYKNILLHPVRMKHQADVFFMYFILRSTSPYHVSSCRLLPVAF